MRICHNMLNVCFLFLLGGNNPRFPKAKANMFSNTKNAKNSKTILDTAMKLFMVVL